MCILRRDLFDTKIWDVVSLILLFLLPLLLLTILYLRIAQVLCASSKLLAQVSYCNSGQFVRTSARPSVSVTGRGCICSTKQEYISSMSVTNNRRVGYPSSAGNCSPSHLVDGASIYNPCTLNEPDETITYKPRGFRKFYLSKRWKKSEGMTSKRCSATANRCNAVDETCFHCSNRTNYCSPDSCIHKVLLQENSASYSSVTDLELSHSRKTEGNLCEGKSQLSSYLHNNYNNVDVIPMCDAPSSRSLQEEGMMETHLNGDLKKPKSMHNIPSATENCSTYSNFIDKHSRKSAPKGRFFARGKQQHNEDSQFQAHHLQHEQQLRANAGGNCRQRENLRRAAIVLRPSPVVLKARRKVVHMLVLVVVSFALFSLPFHTRKMMQYFLPSYNHTSNFSMLFTPVTCLVMFAHSAVNPILYTCLSRKFRASLRDLVTCKLTRRTNLAASGRLPPHNSKPLLARLNPDGRVSLQLH